MKKRDALEVSQADLLELLEQGEIEIEGLLPYSSNYTLLTTVSHRGLQTLAVYKPRRGERPLWDFPRGTLYKREVAAYVTSEALGFSLVPPTVVRDGPYGIGALQFFVESDQESHLLTMRKEGGFEQAILQLVAFDCLINNADRKSGHCLKGLDDRLWAIDHGISFHEEYKLRTVLWDYVGDPFPPDVASGLCAFQRCLDDQQSPVAQVLTDLLDPRELQALRRRLHCLLSAGVYPAPGAGPNVPWPPV
jgi:uncharacterized repeat protein (TIGR03843 family)